MSRYVLTDEAQDDLIQIRDYVLRAGGARVARHVVGAVVPDFAPLPKRLARGTAGRISHIVSGDVYAKLWGLINKDQFSSSNASSEELSSLRSAVMVVIS